MDLNLWPESKGYRRKLLLEALAKFKDTKGSNCLSSAQDVLVYSIGSLMDDAGRSAPLSAPFSPRSDQEQFLALNNREYRPLVGEFPEYDEYMKLLEKLDDSSEKRSPRGAKSEADHAASECHMPDQLRLSIEQRANEALAIL